MIYNDYLFIQFRFLGLIQALETYCRRVQGGKYLPDAVPRGIAAALKAALPPTTPQDLRNSLVQGKIKYGNEYSLRKRLRELLCSLEDETTKLIADSPGKFAEDVTATRNYLTHYSSELQAQAFKGGELYSALSSPTGTLDHHLVQGAWTGRKGHTDTAGQQPRTIGRKHQDGLHGLCWVQKTMLSSAVSLPVLSAGRPMRLTPTDVTQFVRLEQCERFLRFRLAERAGQKFMEEYDVNPQRITPLLSLSGHDFEEGIEADLGKRFPTVNYADKYGKPTTAPSNNNEVVARGPQARARPDRPAVPAPPGGRTRRLAAAWRRGPRAAGAAGGRHPARPDRRHEIHRRGQGRTPPPGRLLPPHAGAHLQGRRHRPHQPVQTGILFRPPADPTPEEEEEIKPLRDAAKQIFGLDDALLEVVADPEAYLQSVHDLVLGKDSTARRVAGTPFEDDPVLPVLQVRRLPVQRVLHEVELPRRKTSPCCRT